MDGPELYYCKDGVLYPVVLSSTQQKSFDTWCKENGPLRGIVKFPMIGGGKGEKGRDTRANSQN